MNRWDVMWAVGLGGGMVCIGVGGLPALGAYFAGVLMVLGAWLSTVGRDYLEVGT